MAQIISLDELSSRQSDGRIAEFWNVLTDEYFTGELIPSSRHVPLDRVGREAGGLTRDTEIVVYCSGTDCPHSKAAGEKLVSLGFTRVHVFEGGLDAWKMAGRTVEIVNRTVA